MSNGDDDMTSGDLDQRSDGAPHMGASARARRLPGIPPSPPPDVARAVQCAARAYERLAAAGCELHFKGNALTRRAIVHVHDLRGNEVQSLVPSELFGLLTEGE